MSNEMFHVLISATAALFFFWLLYRLKRRITRIVRNKIIDEFPHITEEIENLDRKIAYLNSRIELLERKINEDQKKGK